MSRAGQGHGAGAAPNHDPLPHWDQASPGEARRLALGASAPLPGVSSRSNRKSHPIRTSTRAAAATNQPTQRDAGVTARQPQPATPAMIPSRTKNLLAPSVLWLIVLFAVLACSAATSVRAASGDHDLDDDDLIEIYTLEQLDAVRHDLNGDGQPDATGAEVAYYGAFSQDSLRVACASTCRGYELARDLDFGDPDSYASGATNTAWRTGEGWMPIGTEASPFTATFEGNEHAVVNLYILRLEDNADPQPAGLFGYLDSAAAVVGLGVVKADVTGSLVVGALAGFSQGMIEHSHSSGNVDGIDQIGGLVGENHGVIRHSWSSARVLGWSQIGSLVGINYGSILDSHAKGGASGEYEIGALVGFNPGNVSGSYATGSVACAYDRCGGLIGGNYGDIVESYANGTVLGIWRIGGLTGSNEGSISKSYATGRIVGAEDVGGLVGYNNGIVTISYATGSVRARLDSAGGLVGLNTGDIVAAYAIGNISGSTIVGGLIGSIESGTVRATFGVGNVESNGTVGALIGRNHPYSEWETVVVQDSVWDADVSGLLNDVGEGNPSGIRGLATSVLQQTTDYTGPFENWHLDVDNADEDDNPKTGADDVWDFGRSDQYPALKVDTNRDGVATWEEFGPQGRSAGLQSDNSKYDKDGDGLIEVSNLEQLAAMGMDVTGNGRPDYAAVRRLFYAAFPVLDSEEVCEFCFGYELTRSLDFADPGSYAAEVVNQDWRTGIGWRPMIIGDYRSPTTFDGNGHVISNLYSNVSNLDNRTSEAAGLFAHVQEDSVVRNIGVTSVDITGDHNVGGLAATNEGEVLNAFASGRVSGKDNVGGLVGANRRIIRFSHSTTETSGESRVGGLVGWNTAGSRGQEASVAASFAVADVSGVSDVGGLIGRNEEGRVTFAYAKGPVTGSIRVGGLVGVNAAGFYPSNVTASYATGDVSGHEAAGGIAGANSGSIIATYATGSVSGSAVVGGLVGDNSMPWVDRWDEGGQGTVIASYAAAVVSGQSSLGGLAGRNPGRLLISFWDIDASGQSNGAGDGNVPTNSGKATAELQSPAGFTGVFSVWNIDLDNADGDYTLETGAGDFWDFGTSQEYPALIADFDGDGVATWQEFGDQGRDPSSIAHPPTPLETPVPVMAPVATVPGSQRLDSDTDGLIEVSNLEQLNAIRYDLDGNGIPDSAGTTAYATAFPAAGSTPCTECEGYELTRPLDFQDLASYSSGALNPLWTAGSGWLPIGVGSSESSFTATFEGNGYTIRNLFINRTTFLEDAGAAGLFGFTGPSAVIRGIGLNDVRVTGLASVGSLVGENRGIISNSYAAGQVSGTTHVGGLVGYNQVSEDSDQGWQIESSYAEVNVKGTDYVGGLIGLLYGTLRATYASGIVSGDEIVGGLIGGNSGKVRASFASGQVSGRRSIGGLVGHNFDTIDSSYANTDVSGDNLVGGLVGNNEYDVLASYSMGRVSGHQHVGGLVGWNGGTQSPAAIINSYSTAYVVGDELAGGLVGVNRSAVIHSFWDTQATGQSTGFGQNEPSNAAHFPRLWWDGTVQIVGQTSAQLQGPVDYAGIYAPWNEPYGPRGPVFAHPMAAELIDLWDFGSASQYPALTVDFDGDGQPSWEEFGTQVRSSVQGQR